jgi:hypothetical protein
MLERKKLADTGANVQVCALLLGGRKAHVVKSAAALEFLFGIKQVSKEGFNHHIVSRNHSERQRSGGLQMPNMLEGPTQEASRRCTAIRLSVHTLSDKSRVFLVSFEQFRYRPSPEARHPQQVGTTCLT